MNLLLLLTLGLLGGVLHLGVTLGLLLSLLGLLLGLLLSLELGALLSGSLLLGLQDGLALSVDLLLVALDDGSGNEADVILLGDVDGLGGVLTVLVQPVLGGHELGLELLLLLLAGEFGVNTVDLVTQLVDGGLELVLLLVGLSDQLVLHVHGVLTLLESSLDSLVNTTNTGDDGQVTLADLLLDLAGLLGLLLAVGVGVHSLYQKEILVCCNL